MSCAYRPRVTAPPSAASASSASSTSVNSASASCDHPELGRCFTKQHFNPDHTIKVPKKVVIMFFRDGCPHCETLKPTFAQVASSNRDPNVTFGYVNTAKSPELMKQISDKSSPYDVEGVPTIVSYHNGRFFSKFGGDRSLANIQNYSSTVGTADVTFVNK